MLSHLQKAQNFLKKSSHIVFQNEQTKSHSTPDPSHLPNDCELAVNPTDPPAVQKLKKNMGGNNMLIDFSTAGFQANANVPLSIEYTGTIDVSPAGGEKDDAPLIQAAIDRAKGPTRIQLGGTYQIRTSIRISKSNILLKGPAVFKISGERRTIITVTGAGNGPRFNQQHQSRIIDNYVPVGATSFHVHDSSSISVGSGIIIQRQITDQWVAKMQMDCLSRNGSKQTWLDNKCVMNCDRVVTGIRGNQIQLDAALPEALTAATDGQSLVFAYDFPGRIEKVGIRDLTLQCSASARASTAVNLNALKDCFISCVNTEDFDSQFTISPSCKRVTVSSCSFKHSNDNMSQKALPAEIEVRGSQILVTDCQTTGESYQTFCVVTQSKVSGPNVVLRYTGSSRRHMISPHQRWAVGLLIDSCQVGNVSLSNRGVCGSGHGWTVGWGIAWNCDAGSFKIENPPGARNFAIGCAGHHDGNGILIDCSGKVEPQSLFEWQLRARRPN